MVRKPKSESSKRKESKLDSVQKIREDKKARRFRQKQNCARTDEEKKKENNLINEEVCEISGETEMEE